MNKKEQKPLYAIGLFGFYKKQPPDPRYAGFNRRMLAATIDLALAIFLLQPIFTVVMQLIAPLPDLNLVSLQQQIKSDMPEETVNRLVLQHLIDSGYLRQWFGHTITNLLLLAVISGLCWRLWGATPGKKLLRMKVVDATTGELLSDMQAILRLIGYVISTIFLCVGFFWIEFDKRRQAWHDKLARSVVVMVPKSAEPAAAASDSREPIKEE
ncbi:MAG: RDD family protein [Bacteroidota bacterium]